MRFLLLIRGYYDMVINAESPEKAAEQLKVDPDRICIAYAIISLNYNVKVASQFEQKSSYLGKIFSNFSSDSNLLQCAERVQELARNLRNIINYQAIKPSTLLDSVVAMWIIINLPGEYKFIGEIWLKFRVDKSPPALDKAIEEIKAAIQRNKENHEKQALFARKKEKCEYENTQHHTYPTCRPGFHNPLTQNPESKCRNLKLGKPITAFLCSPRKQDQNSIVLDSGASNSMFNNQKYFITFFPKEEVLLFNGSKIKTLGSGIIRIELPHMYLKIRNCLPIPQLSINLLSLNSFINTNYTVKKISNPKFFEVINTKGNIILNASYGSSVTVIHHVEFNDSNIPACLNHLQDSNDDSFTTSGKLIIQPSNNLGLRIEDGTSLEGNEVETLPSEIPQPTESSIIYDEVPSSSMTKAIPNANKLPNPSNSPKQVKEYIWSNEPINKSKKVISDAGDPQRIRDKPRRKKYTANSSEILHNDPKNYKQAMCHKDSDNWKKSISQELRNIEKNEFWSPTSDKKRNKFFNQHLGVQEKY
ncbi:hypothetical protein O181_010747 [Austropuccinia psidii MF-1]|uniref:Retrovirus-related Pol polyprotein from transposon TNT 1-94-like beta-barrel domain-containing protein n=1 Tax=Austropuccinia psidii MF-1 TaxID=1389203 RepID=A0A9Q3BUC7_9BASI|nr:hypothetical protein [Austropuccinia psidii MF-1]